MALPQPSSHHRSQLPIFRALQHRNYRLFFFGQCISLIGTWMQQIAISWLVYRMTHSAFILGFVGFASQIPAFLLTPFAGVIADRMNRHKLVILTQTLAMIQAFILAFLTLGGTIQVWQIIGLGVFMGMINAQDMPSRQAFMVDMVENKGDLANAIALNSSIVNVARLIGPSIAGLLIAAVGEGYCFLINAISYIAVIIALLMMQIKPKHAAISQAKILTHLKEGLQYAFGFSPIRAIILLLALVSLVGMPYTILMPVFVTKTLHGSAQTLGFLMGAVGIGALTGAMYLANRKAVLGLGKWIAISSIVFGCGLVAFSFSKTLWICLLILMVMGFGMMVQMASSNTVLQTVVDEDKRGRVMSLYAMAFMGMAPFGCLMAGAVANRIGVPYTILLSGVICLAGAFLFTRKLPALREEVRPIYVEKGILIETPLGFQTE